MHGHRRHNAMVAAAAVAAPPAAIGNLCTTESSIEQPLHASIAGRRPVRAWLTENLFTQGDFAA